MRVPNHPTLVRRMLNRRLQKLVPTGPILSRVNKRCCQPSCSCYHGGPLHQAHHLEREKWTSLISAVCEGSEPRGHARKRLMQAA